MTALLERPTDQLTWECIDSSADYDYDDDAFFRAWAGDTLVARAEVRPETIHGQPGIWGVFVHEDHRQQGHARSVMRRVIDKCVERGYTEVLLKVETDNTPAMALYRSLGFTVESRNVGVNCRGNEYDLTIMQLAL